MGIIIYIIFGALVGWVASMIMHDDKGLIGDIVVGVVGAFLGGVIMNSLGQTGVYGFNFYSFLVALLGACLFIYILRMVRRQK